MFLEKIVGLAGQPNFFWQGCQIFVLFCSRFFMYSSVGSILWEATVGRLAAGGVDGRTTARQAFRAFFAGSLSLNFLFFCRKRKHRTHKITRYTMALTMVSEMSITRRDHTNPQALFKGSFTRPLRSRLTIWLEDF